MNPVLHFLARMFNLRTLIVAVAIWLCLGLHQPSWLQRLSSQVDLGIFHFAMDLSHVPLSQSHITVVHVPSLEYQSWLADLPGARRLERFLKHSLADEQQQAIVGLVLEQPLSLIQSQAEGLLMDVQLGRSSKDPLFNEVDKLLSRREQLVQSLQDPRVILGVQQVYSGRFNVRSDNVLGGSDANTSSAAEFQPPSWLRNGLWRPAAHAQNAVAPNPVFNYVSIWPKTALYRALVTRFKQQTIPGFELMFLQASAAMVSASNAMAEGVAQEPIIWRKDQGFFLGDSHYPASLMGDVIPLYGAHSNMRSSLRQLSLDAALESSDLSGWILIGRDGSATVEMLAQSIAALADGAQIFEPLWWGPSKRALLLFFALFLCFGAPAMTRYWKLTSVSALVFSLILASVLAQSIGGYWLSVAELILYLGFGVAVISLWQWQVLWSRQRDAQVQQTKLRLSDQLIHSGNYSEALEVLRGCNMQPDLLPRLYSLGQLLADQSQYAAAKDAYGLIIKYQRAYKDVQVKVQQLDAQQPC